jgi:hypothetical protein
VVVHEGRRHDQQVEDLRGKRPVYTTNHFRIAH